MSKDGRKMPKMQIKEAPHTKSGAFIRSVTVTQKN